MNKWTRFVTSILFLSSGQARIEFTGSEEKRRLKGRESKRSDLGGSDNGLRGEGVDQDFQARGPMLTAS